MSRTPGRSGLREGGGFAQGHRPVPPKPPVPRPALVVIPGSIIFILFLTWKKLETLNLSKLVGSCNRKNMQQGGAQHYRPWAVARQQGEQAAKDRGVEQESGV